MSADSILAQIDAEIARLVQVRSLLASTTKVEARITGRKTKKASAAAKVKKTRWAAQKARSKKEA